MNASLTLHHPVSILRQPARSHLLAALLAFIRSIFTYDDPAALRYIVTKYNGLYD
jgi:hypothetical protein